MAHEGLITVRMPALEHSGCDRVPAIVHYRGLVAFVHSVGAA